VLFHPDAFENLFVSFAHSDSDIECTLQAVEAALPAVRRRLR
jgi:glutamate-1-semialdehyde 2,1-aminomutase